MFSTRLSLRLSEMADIIHVICGRRLFSKCPIVEMPANNSSSTFVILSVAVVNNPGFNIGLCLLLSSFGTSAIKFNAKIHC